MANMIFDEKTMIDGNIFKYEKRLKSHLNKYVENGALLVTYYTQDENSSTVDRGLQDINQLFGNKSPIRYNKIENFPVYGFGQANPNNTDEQQIEDFDVNGTCIIQPSTIVPRPYDLFIIRHLKMTALFMVTNVEYDSMKVEGYYRITYRLQSTSDEYIQDLERRVITKYITDLNAIGSEVNPIIKEEDSIKKNRIMRMLNQMISSYKALFYNSRHNCFLYHDDETGLDWFDMCGNEFMAKYSLMNMPNSSEVIVLNEKLNDPQFPYKYQNSIFNWIELDAPEYLLQKFAFKLTDASGYLYSSFVRWGDEDVQIMHPLSTKEDGIMTRADHYFDDTQLKAFMNKKIAPLNEYEKLIWEYIHHKNMINIDAISLYTGTALLNSVKHRDIYLYTPIIIYIIRNIISWN